MRLAQRLVTALLGVMVIQASTGLLFQSAYHDVEWVRATWFGNDWVTLVVAVPLLGSALRASGRGSVQGLLISVGVVAYAVYNYAFYLFGAALNAFLPVYVAAWVLSLAALLVIVLHIDVEEIARSFRPTLPRRLVGGSLLVVAAGLACVWLGMWAAHVFADRATPIPPEMFKLVAALDLSLMVPPLAVGGALVWRRAAWGYVIGAIASIQACLYLLVLSVNSVVAIQRGLANAPGELPFWGPLALLTGSVAAAILANASDSHELPETTRLAARDDSGLGSNESDHRRRT